LHFEGVAQIGNQILERPGHQFQAPKAQSIRFKVYFKNQRSTSHRKRAFFLSEPKREASWFLLLGDIVTIPRRKGPDLKENTLLRKLQGDDINRRVFKG